MHFSFRNTPEYAKLGFGVLATVHGVVYAFKHVNTIRLLEEAVYRNVEDPSPEKLVEAQHRLHNYLHNYIENNPDCSTGEVREAFWELIIGPALIASGIQNLVRNYRREH